MFDWFNTHNDNERHQWRPRIIFATLRHSAHPILSEQGYKTFSLRHLGYGLWGYFLSGFLTLKSRSPKTSSLAFSRAMVFEFYPAIKLLRWRKEI